MQRREGFFCKINLTGFAKKPNSCRMSARNSINGKARQENVARGAYVIIKN